MSNEQNSTPIEPTKLPRTFTFEDDQKDELSEEIFPGCMGWGRLKTKRERIIAIEIWSQWHCDFWFQVIESTPEELTALYDEIVLARNDPFYNGRRPEIRYIRVVEPPVMKVVDDEEEDEDQELKDLLAQLKQP